MMFNEYFTCKSSAKPSCKADEEVLGGKADAATCTKCEGDYAKCRMDATFDIKLYMTKAEFTAGQTKFIKAIADSMSVYTANVTLVSATEGATHIMSKQTTVKVKVSLGKKKDAKTGGGDSANPKFNPTFIQNNLITAGFTMAATKGPGQTVGGAVRTASIASLGLYDVGSMLGFELPEYTAIKGILDAATAFKVELTVQISSTKAAFTAEKEEAFKGAVAASAGVPKDNVLITVTEKTTSRRTSRKLLATVLEIAITILVKDKAAGDALVAGDGLKQTKLNEQLALQGLPTITKMVSEPKTAAPSNSNSTDTTGLSAAHRAEPTMALNLFISFIAMVSATRFILH